jgi:hypothetical protein
VLDRGGSSGGSEQAYKESDEMKIKVGTMVRMFGALGTGRKIQAIKLVRDECEVGIKDAKEFVDMFCYQDGCVDNLSLIEVTEPMTSTRRYTVVDEELIFDQDLAAECPLDPKYLTDYERTQVVEEVLELVLDSLSPFVRKALKAVLYRRFMNLPDSVRDLTMEMLNDKFFHI